MEPQTTLSRSSNLKEYSALVSTMTSGNEYDLQERSLKFAHASANTTQSYWIAANAPLNSTICSGSIVLQRIDDYEEYRLCADDTSALCMAFASLFDKSSGEATETHIRSKCDFSRLLYRPQRSLGTQLIVEQLALPDSLWLSIQEQEKQEIIYADTNQAISFGELLHALDRISRPVEVESTPLPVDPDDYPVV